MPPPIFSALPRPLVSRAPAPAPVPGPNLPLPIPAAWGLGAEAAPRRFRSNARLQRIKNYRWEVGRASPELLARMSPAEREFLETYETLLGEYDLQEDGSFLDLFVDMKPPKDPYIKVRVKRTLGDLHFRWLGSVSLEKGAVVTLPRDEAERLILEGLLEDFEE